MFNTALFPKVGFLIFQNNIWKYFSYFENSLSAFGNLFFGQIPVELDHFTRSSGIFLAAAERARKKFHSIEILFGNHRTHPNFSIQWNLSIECFRDLTFT